MSTPIPADPRRAAGWLVRSAQARWAFVVLASALAAILVFATVSTWSTARAAHDTMVQGQAAALFHALRRDVPPGPPRAVDDMLGAFLEDHREAGLRYVAIVDGPDRVLAAAGRSAVDAVAPPPPDRVFTHGDIVRMAAPLGPGPPPRLGRPGPPPPRLLVIEFEPALGTALQAHAQRSLAIGIAGAVGLLLVGGVFFALSRRAAVVELQLAEQRHLAALGEMSAVLAHELRNPLASLRGHAQLLQEQLPEGRGRDKATRVVDETSRLQRLIDGLLEFARSGSITRTPTDPVALVHAAAADVAPERIDVVTDDAPPTWSLDGPRVQQVLTNLLANALQASGPDDRIEVTVSRRGEQLRFAVRDRGPGVPAEVRGRLFEAFQTTRTRGVGLGLAVARRIVELHGGRLGFSDGAPTGTVFEVELPAGR